MLVSISLLLNLSKFALSLCANVYAGFNAEFILGCWV